MENSAQISPKAAEPIIKVRGLRHVYQEGDGTKEVLHGIDLDIFSGEIVIIMVLMRSELRKAFLTLSNWRLP